MSVALSSAGRRRWLRFATPAVDSLRMFRGTAVLIGAAGVAALTALVPLTSLETRGSGPATSLRVIGVPASEAGSAWTRFALHPAAVQQTALDETFSLLLTLAWTAALVAAVVILSLAGARAAIRAPEIAVRRAVGASRRDLLAAALVEGLMVGAAVLLAGSAIGFAAARAAALGWSGPLDGWHFAPLPAAGAVGAMLVLGMLLPLAFTRTRRIVEQDETPPGLLLPTLQLGISLAVLLASAAVQARAGRMLEVGAAGSARDGLVFELDAAGLPAAERAAQYARLMERLGARAEIETASLTSPGELVGLGTSDVVTTDCGMCMSSGFILRWRQLAATQHFVSADTFEAQGLRVIEGRGLTEDDRWDARRVAVVNRQLAGRHFQQGQAVGRDIFFGAGWPREPYTVVGIVDDPQPMGFGGSLQPRETVYLSVLQHPPGSSELLVRARDAKARVALLDALSSAPGVRAVGSSLSETRRVAREAEALAWFGRWFGVEGWILLALAVAGVFSSMGLWVRAVGPEFSLRRAVGATRRQVLGLVLLRALRVATGGVALGWILFGVVLWEPLSATIAGLSVGGPAPFARYALLLAGATLAGAALPVVVALRTPPAHRPA
jgi:putative ABC transport system permease protein